VTPPSPPSPEELLRLARTAGGPVRLPGGAVLFTQPQSVAQVLGPGHDALLPLSPTWGAQVDLLPALEPSLGRLSQAAGRAASLALRPVNSGEGLAKVACRALGSALFGGDHDAFGSPLPAALDVLAGQQGEAARGKLAFLVGRLLPRRRESGDGADVLSAALELEPDDGEAVARVVSLAQTALPSAAALLQWAVLQVAVEPGAAQPLEPAAFVRELLRLYPPAWLQRFSATRPVEVGGVRLAAGEEAWTSPFVTQRLESLYAQPDRFLPRRAGLQAGYAFFPFGTRDGGALGQVVERVVAESLRAFVASLQATAPDGMPPPEAGEVLHPAGPVRLDLQRRGVA
jgi:cytochrome P450